MVGFVHYILDYLGKNIILIASDPLFIGLALLILVMYKRVAKQANNRNYRYKIEYTAVKDIIRGVAIGCLLSLVLEMMGIRIPVEGQLVFLIPVAIALIFMNPKWGCFSYVVPVTYLVHLLISIVLRRGGFEAQTYRELVLLVGVLHIVEGLLVILWGHENPREEPVQVGNTLVRGKQLTKYWPVPLMVFHTAHGGITPLILYAFLGYGDVAIGGEPKKKSHLTGSIILLYGVCITIIGIYTIKKIIPLTVVIILMPFLHEGIFKLTYRLEKVLETKKSR